MKKNKRNQTVNCSLSILLTMLLVWAIPFLVHAQSVNVSDFGVKANSFLDATEGVQKAISACKDQSATTLVFPAGRYDFWPDKAIQKEYFISNTSSETECPSKVKHIGLLFENIKNLTVEGNGSLFVFHGKMVTWALDHCENVQLRHITVDFERPSMSEMTFMEVTPNYVIAAIHPDSRHAIIDHKLCWYGEGWGMNHYHAVLKDTIAGTSIYSSWKPIQEGKTIAMEPFMVRVEGKFDHANYKAGQTLTVRDPIRDHVGAFVNQSKNIGLEHVTMHYMHGLGIVSQFSEDLTYRHVHIVPSRGRTVAAFADGMHFSGCKGTIRIEHCRFKGLHDDPVNVHGTYLQITEIHSPTRLTIAFKHHQSYGFPAFFENDTIAFIHTKSLQTKGFSMIRSARLTSEREMLIEFTNPLPKEISLNDCIENITWTPSLEVRNNRFEMTNARGMLVTTPRKVLIENNVFYRTGMYGILIAGDAGSWFESGAVKDVMIRNNTFDGCGFNMTNNSYSISIEPENHMILPKHWVHRNIRIEKNIFRLFDTQIIRARSTENLTIEDNTIEYTPFQSPLKQEQTHTAAQFKLENCAKVSIRKNTCKLNGQTIKAECTDMKKKDIIADKPVQLIFKQ